MRPMILFHVRCRGEEGDGGTDKLLNQFEQVDNDTPFARSVELKSSVGIAQATGPQLRPKATMYTKMKETPVQAADLCCSHSPW